jgi:hypothetical protein
MEAGNFINLYNKYLAEYGETVTWPREKATVNSRGETIYGGDKVTQSARVIILKDNFSPLSKILMAAGLVSDPSKYVMAPANTDLIENDVLTDSNGVKFRLGAVDFFALKGTNICLQSKLTRVDYERIG